LLSLSTITWHCVQRYGKMARLEKMQIQGFRSFGPDDGNPGPQIITFASAGGGGAAAASSSGLSACPLTLILGKNGCGKTTIIECLRYITSGDPPPGSNKGSTFVHDPKMARERETTGCVKLQYRGIDGNIYTVMRSMQAIVKGKNIACRTLDATITKRTAEGSAKSLSMKCADINQTMFSTMGVSKAILNYVVFCHQEDSNWPLEEGSKVKAKFDEIFESTRYNGCLKNLKEVRQGQLDQIRLGKKDAEFFNENRKDARKKQSQLQMKLSDRTRIERDLDAIKEDLKPLEAELRDVREVEQNFAGIQANMTEAQTNLEHYKKEMQDIRSQIGQEIPLSTSNEEIRRKRRELDQQKDELAGEIEDKDGELRKVEGQIRKATEASKKVESQIGECKAMRNKYEKDHAELARKLRKACAKYGWEMEGASDSMMTGEQMQDVIENVRGMLKLRREELVEKEAKLQDEIDARIEKWSDLQAQKAQLDEKQKGKRAERSECNKEVARINRKLNELEGARDQLERLRTALKSKEDQLEKAQTSGPDLNQLREQLKADKAELKAAETKAVQVQREKQKLEAVRDKMLVIASKKKDVEAKEAALKRLLSKYNSELAAVFGGATGIPEPKEIRAKFQAKSRQLELEKKGLEDEVRRFKSKQELAKENRRSLIAERQRIEQRVAAFDQSLELVMDGSGGSDGFDEELARVKDEVEKTRTELQSKEANKFTFREFVGRLEAMKGSHSVQPSCPTCHRHFEETSQVDDLIGELTREVDKIPAKVNSIQKKLDRSKRRLEQLQDLLPEKRQTDELKDKLKDIRDKVSGHDRDLKELADKVSECDDKLDVVGADYSVCDELNREEVAVRIGQLSEDSLATKAQIADLEDEMGEAAGGEGGDGGDAYNRVVEEETKLAGDMVRLRGKIETDQTREIEHERKLNQLQKERNELFNRKLQIESNQQERAANEEKKADLESKVASINLDLEQVQRDLAPIAASLEAESKAKAELEARKKSEVQAAQRQIEALRDAHNNMQSEADNLKDYQESGNDDTLEKLTSDRGKFARQLTDLDGRQKSVRSERSELERKLNNQSSIKRNFDDNLKLREYAKKEAETADKVRKYEDQLNVLDYATLKRKKEKAQRRWQELEGQQLRLMGQMTELGRTIEDVRTELDQDKLKNAEENYRKKTVELELRKHVSNDLSKYYSALEWSIMRFHRERMDQINKIIRELWRATYKGNDIEYIEVKTEDADSLTGADRVRKKYNYSVVMVKNDVEMEMRGRCSAGQKVLASLIIRLALAETFSANCGMIALDEPTTNLDGDNIESLAEALIEIVEKRSRQTNFQLIVISHDNDLVEMLGKSDQVEHYFRVSRNASGLSLIRKNHFAGR